MEDLPYLAGLKVWEPRTFSQMTAPSSATAFAGIQITIDPFMKSDEFAILPHGEAVMSHAKYAELMRAMQDRVDQRITDAVLYGDAAPASPEPEPDPEEEDMKSSELWGAF